MRLYKYFKKKHITALYYMITLSFVFAIIYYLAGKDHLTMRGTQNQDIDLLNSFYFSVTTQSLLGTGEIMPQTPFLKIIVIIQIFTTLLVNFIY